MATGADVSWVARQRRRAFKVEIAERSSSFTMTRTVTTWHHCGKVSRRVARREAKPQCVAEPAQRAAQLPASPAEKDVVMRDEKNCRQKRTLSITLY